MNFPPKWVRGELRVFRWPSARLLWRRESQGRDEGFRTNMLGHKLGMLPQPVVGSLNLHHDGMMPQSVEQCGGDNGIAEDITLFYEVAV